ncbi:nucleotide exchange factor GrpE [Algisphaera agarilytica]|uniref:Protein GrpE n=1 Tax=Algisphaera agarilytica TaxID=1385975 RepID=A0A7X0LMU5_9BACT|nr:nucleotide exchange factor GrpE [Algisphaera agarilytica]MBB6431388.1 molecular chaperone GrpE [Algisphaera agarilytica]
MSENIHPNDDLNAAEDSAEVNEFDLTPEGDEPTLADFDPEAAEAEAEAQEVIDEEFAALQKERDELEAKLMRTAADYQNFVRRSQLNIDATKQETLMKVAKALVGVMDNFDRALELDPETTSAGDVQKGAATIQAALLQALEGFGMKKVTVEPGDEFDPNLHEALMRQPSEDIESNHVAAQFMPGYILNDQPVRPAQVSVAE